MRTKTMKLTVAAVAAAAALSLVACDPEGGDATGDAAGAGGGSTASAPAAGGGTGGSGGSGGSTASAAAGGKGTGSAGGSTASTGAGAGTAGTTGGGAAGGTGGGKLTQAAHPVKIGQPATVDFTDKQASVTTKLQVTVTGVEIGSIKDFQDAKASTANLDGQTLVYVSYTIKNVGDASLSFTAPDSKFVVADPTGRNGVFQTPVGTTPIAKCTPAKFQGVKKDMEVKGCTIIGLAGANNTPAQVGYLDLNDRLKLQASWTK
ncbi:MULTISPECIES: hypothetical protein [Kitasatospora]|uniref:DUF4352 domain-containing protein n=1 Tax=Kitasatospora setae (strain ATCC 33774 / DSM 43861 / JCM 3304 / KCC A-0304 / NBRC 14216 / KM-6054) TaxID=452652 RepID=E4N905_KITSK|nr:MULTISPECIES: hypothetical protein [Kitasatospora]BAJ27686.1 hypothetical protein KSE_18610 [Kitasatospora setae KM-6054]